MNESRTVLINLNTTLYQFLVICLCHHKCIPFIRNMWHNDNYFHSTLGYPRQCHDHLIIQDQVRSHNMNIFLRMIQNMEINFFTDILIVIRAVSVRNYISQFSPEFFSSRCQIFCIVFSPTGIQIPHLKKHHSKTLYRITF